MTISTLGRHATLSFIGVGLLSLAGLVQAQVKGPDPTLASITRDGPFAVATQSAPARGFGGGTVYAPTAAGTYALVAFCPGFTATQSSIAAMGRRLATHGFVVVTMNTNSTFDQPASRSTQLIAALNAVAAITTGNVAGKVDNSRRVVTGHSMGGGGTLQAATNNSSLKAAVPLAPWHTTKSFSGDRVPTAIIGGSADTVAPVGSHSTPFYNSISQAEKLLGIISGASHFFPQDNPANQPASYVQIAWIKRFADGDTRYTQFLNGDSRFSTFRSTAPF